MNEIKPSENLINKIPISRKPVFKISIYIFIFIVGYVSANLLAKPAVYQCPQCQKEDDTPKLTDYSEGKTQETNNPVPGYFTPPLFPGYTQDWKLYVSEKNNLLFLYPPDFIQELSSNEVYVPIIFKNPNTSAEIIVQRLEDITTYEKTLEYESFVNKIKRGEQVEKYGYLINFKDDATNNFAAQKYGYNERNIDNNKVYQSVYFRNEGW